jgi:hypothetical protein
MGSPSFTVHPGAHDHLDAATLLDQHRPMANRRTTAKPSARPSAPPSGTPSARRSGTPSAPSSAHPSFEVVAHRLAGRQHGVVARRQLVEAGVAAHVVDQRVECGRLMRIHRGVYRFGPLVAEHSEVMAACLACGAGAAASFDSAAVVLKIRPVAARPAEVEIAVRGGGRRRPGIRVHRVRSFRPSDLTCVEGIPVTTVNRTLCDLATRLAPRALEQAVAEALALRSTTARKLRAAAIRRRGRPGAARLLDVLGDGNPALTRSPAEERFLALVRAVPVPEPEVNQRVGPYEVDFLWREARLIAETDGFGYHQGRRAFERDRGRDADLLAMGFRVMRVTWRKLNAEPGVVLDQLIKALNWAG